MPRPVLPSEERRTEFFKVSATPKQARLLRERAAAAGLRPAVYLLKAALERRLVPPRTPPVNFLAISELQRLGNNLNQAVKLLHQGRTSPGFGGLLTEILRAIKTFHRDLLGLQSSGDRKAD